MKFEKKICGYICKENPFEDKKAWSGLIFKIRESIENAGFVCKWIPFKDNLSLIDKICLHINKNTTGHSIRRAKKQGQSIDITQIQECDFLFIPSGSELLPYIKTNKPAIIYGDATFKVMNDYYFHNVSKHNYKEGMILEKQAIDVATIVCKASNWAINSVINDYGCPSSKCHVLLFGANLEDKDICHIYPYSGGRLNVLFSGVEWDRKGAHIAIDTIDILRKKYGIDAHLMLCGINDVPIEYQGLNFVEYIGFLNKNAPKQYRKYIDTIKKCHIFLLPTKAECAGIVFCEASAYGLPIYTFDTGGIGDYVKNGINGYRIPMGGQPSDFAEMIINTLDTDSQQKLHEGCLKMYENELNWNVWSIQFSKILKTL